MPASMTSCRQLVICWAIVQGTCFGCKRVSSLLSHKVLTKGGEGVVFGNKPSCWFLPGLKAQANAKTKATHRKARILGAIPHMIYIYHIYSSYIYTHRDTYHMGSSENRRLSRGFPPLNDTAGQRKAALCGQGFFCYFTWPLTPSGHL